MCSAKDVPTNSHRVPAMFHVKHWGGLLLRLVLGTTAVLSQAVSNRRRWEVGRDLAGLGAREAIVAGTHKTRRRIRVVAVDRGPVPYVQASPIRSDDVSRETWSARHYHYSVCPTSNTPVRLGRLNELGTCSPSGWPRFPGSTRCRSRALPRSRLVRVTNGSSHVLHGAEFVSPKQREFLPYGTYSVQHRTHRPGSST